MKNSDRFASFIVNKVVDLMVLHFGDNVSAATLDTVRSTAVLATKNTINFPLQFTFNSIAASEESIKHTEEKITKIVDRGIKVITPEILSSATALSAAVKEIVKTAVYRGIDTGVLCGKTEPVSDTLKSYRTTAAFLAFLLGFIGAHKYYLGQKWQGIIFTLAVVCTFGFAIFVTGLIGLVDAIRFLTMSDEVFAAKYTKSWSPMIIDKN